jgi:DNA-binding NarL/FixJ family response regulator
VKVLIVDDHALLANALMRILESEWECSCAYSIDDAIAQIQGGAPDLLLIDLAMPRGGGQALYRWIRSVLPELAARVIFMTGFSEEIAREALGPLPNPILLKPFEHEIVLRTLRAAAASRAPIR